MIVLVNEVPSEFLQIVLCIANFRCDKKSMSKYTCPEPGDIRIIKGEWREESRVSADDDCFILLMKFLAYFYK